MFTKKNSIAGDRDTPGKNLLQKLSNSNTGTKITSPGKNIQRSNTYTGTTSTGKNIQRSNSYTGTTSPGKNLQRSNSYTNTSPGSKIFNSLVGNSLPRSNSFSNVPKRSFASLTPLVEVKANPNQKFAIKKLPCSVNDVVLTKSQGSSN
jgi:hypothetical protein